MKIRVLLSLFIGSLLFFLPAVAQKTSSKEKSQKMATPIVQRCATSEGIKYRLQTDPAYFAAYQKKMQEMEKVLAPSANGQQKSSRLTDPVIIPVVVHIVLPNPSIVTDADVQAFIDRLNVDFSGLNSDSTNAVDFYSKRGHSLIRFALAKRDPNGKPTVGIERKNGNVSISVVEPQPLKNSNLGGLSPWPHTQYYNIWVGVGSNSLLGISPEIGPGTAATDGVSIDYRAFSTNSCYTYSSFNLARTAVHEIGHNFGLYHTFEGNCSNSDFSQITSVNLSLPASLLASSDDTPAQNNSTNGCPSGSRDAGCSGSSNPPGRMYQNFMDYTNDGCYSMFTIGQVERMHYVLENFRAGYLTTQGHIPIATPALDASAYESVNPGGSEASGCAFGKVYPSTLSCTSSSMEPKFRIRNNGTNLLTSIIAGYQLNNGTAITKNVALNLAPGESTVVTFAAISAPAGNNEFKFFTNSPNGAADGLTANDTIIAYLNVLSPTFPFVKEDFENQFPPLGWSVSNPDNEITWQRSSPGKNSSYSAFMNNYDYETIGETDDLRTPTLILQNVESMIVSFDLAHKSFGIGSEDTLSILASTDCGNTYTTIYKKWGAALSTSGTSADYFNNPSNDDWRRESITVNSSLLSNNSLLFAFRNTTKWGNNIFIDNVQIDPLFKRDIELISINKPGNIICENNLAPSIVIRNKGTETITGFKLSYKIDNGSIQTSIINNVNLTSSSIATIPLPSSIINNTGNHKIEVYAWDLVSIGGIGDMLTLNDTLRKEFTFAGSVKDSINEDFEKVQFLPPNWSRVNKDGGITWIRSNIGRKSNGSAYINNYNYESFGEQDELYTPILKFDRSDSLVLSFDLSAAVYSLPTTKTIPLDTLEILVTKDCGNTFTSVYKKWGDQLQTLNQPNEGFEDEFFPTQDKQWRKERIDLSSFAEAGSILVSFRNTTNWENNIFLDNINIVAKNVPQTLRDRGYLVTSTANPDKFNIWHYEQPKNLQYISVHTASGQMIWQKAFNGEADKIITVDLSGKPAGVYIISFGYTGNKGRVSERIIKK